MIIFLLFLLTWVVFGVKGGMLGGFVIACAALGLFAVLRYIFTVILVLYAYCRMRKYE